MTNPNKNNSQPESPRKYGPNKITLEEIENNPKYSDTLKEVARHLKELLFSSEVPK